MKKRNRILAMLLTAILTLSMLPSEAFATEAIDTGETAAAAVEEVVVSSVGEEQEVEATTEYEAQEVEEVEETVAEEAVAEEAVAEEAVEPTADQEDEATAEETVETEEEATEEAETEEAADPAADQEDEEAAEDVADPAETEATEPAAEAEVEAVTEETEATVEWPITLETRGDDYAVTATFDESAGFPADVTMKVSEIKKGSDAYQDYYDQALEAIQNETDKDVELTEARFFDITFYTKDGEVEPTGPVNVSIKYRKAIDVESKDDVHVLHFDDNDNAAPQIMDIETDGRGDKVNEVSFETDSFSIYAVVGTGAITQSRMALNFYKRNDDGGDDELIATVYVKNGDTTDAEIKEIIYDPGAGTLSSNELFKGWIENKDYTTEDLNDKMTIADIRTWAKNKANSMSITEGEKHDFYAMVFKTYSVTYKDEEGVAMHSVALISDGGSVDYTIDQTYTPKDQDQVFMGWYANPEGNVTPKDTTVEPPYKYNTEVEISGSVVFTVSAPSGHWLNFEGNGKGADYTPPQFLVTDAVTTKPSNPTRNGYEFAGWYTGAPTSEGQDPTGDEFTFGSTLSANTTLYAKWTPKSTANFSIIIWVQRATDDKDAADENKTYDVAEVISPIEGTTGSSASSYVTQTGSVVNTGRNQQVRNYVVNGQEKAYDGFHAGKYDQDVAIAAEGTTVLNVYYDRNLITINFDAGNSGGWFSSDYYINDSVTGNYVNTVSYTGLYDSELTFVWPTRYWSNNSGTGNGTNTLWTYRDGNSNVTLTFLGAFKLPTETNVSISLSRANAGNAAYRFIKQKPDGTWPELSETDYVVIVNAGVGDFKTSEKFAGFTLSEYREGDYTTGDEGWTATAAEQTIPVSSSGINLRFKRDKYKITYLDGTYFNGDGAILQEATETPWHESGDIYYAASIASYNQGKDDYYEPPKKNQFVFAGWYLDPTCSTDKPYEFTTMPAGGLTVYAKWVEKQYRVFLHPNVPADDTTFNMGNQSTCFRADYDEQIAGGNPIKTQRDSFDLIGWYEADGTPFNFAAYKLNDTTVTTPYDTNDNDKYDPSAETELDKYGNVISGKEGYNADADKQRVWILTRLDLYASWRSTIDGAKGIKVEYVPGAGSNEPVDPLYYLDKAEATAGAASTPTDDKKQFKHWVVQKYNYTTNEYEDTDVIVYPGDIFTVLKADSKALVTEWVNPYDENDVYEVTDPQPGTTPPDIKQTIQDPEHPDDPEATIEVLRYSKIKTASYTVQVRAEYGAAEAPTPTHITWYANNGTGETITDTDLQINEAVDIKKLPETFSYTNYDFLGWAKKVEVSDADGNVTEIGGASPENLALDLGEDDLFLKWDADSEKFVATATTGSGYAEGDEVTQIAADEKSPYHGMVAVWKRSKFYIYHSSDGEVDPVEVPIDDTVDLTTYVKDGYLYGGYYHYDEDDNGQRTKGDAYDANGMKLVPTAHTYYYLKEVNDDHLKPKIILIENKLYNNLVQGLYSILSIDENAYSEVGLIINGVRRNGEDQLAELAEEITITKDGKVVKTYNGDDFKFSGCTLGLVDICDLIDSSKTYEIKGYIKTPDGVVVTGKWARNLAFPAGDNSIQGGKPLFKGWGRVDEGKTETSVQKSTDSEIPYYDGAKSVRMNAVRVLMLSAPSDKIEYKITKIYDSSTEEQIVEGGNYIGNVTYAPKSGYMFAGWYQDAAYTVPADFANVTGDMTVYAKYISEKDITIAFSLKSKKSNTTTFNTTISVKNRDQLENVTANVNDDISAVLSNKSVKKTGSGKNVKYTTQYKGTVAVKGLSTRDTFKASVSWTTPDGTIVTGTNRNCTYILGIVTVK